MNENDKPRGERRRSSRRGRRGSGGADRSAQTPQSQNQAPAQAARPSGQPQRQNRSGQPQSRNSQRSADGNRQATQSQGQNRRNQRGQSARSGQVTAPAASPGRPAPTVRDRFSPPKSVSPVLPKPVCPRCGSPIEDLPSAITDKETGEPVHFDCVLARLSENEPLGDGEKIVYLGGGRFGVVQFENPADLKHFRVKKTLQWEEKDKRADWRRQVTDLYSST